MDESGKDFDKAMGKLLKPKRGKRGDQLRPVQAVDERTLTAEEKQTLDQLRADYSAAAKVHVPRWRGGGISTGIAIALIQGGWRKKARGT